MSKDKTYTDPEFEDNSPQEKPKVYLGKNITDTQTSQLKTTVLSTGNDMIRSALVKDKKLNAKLKKKSEEAQTLSDKIYPVRGKLNMASLDVEEAIRKLKEELYQDFANEDGGSYGVIEATIDKHMGAKLT